MEGASISTSKMPAFMSITPPVPVAVRVPSTIGAVRRTELCVPVALVLMRRTPLKPLMLLGFKSKAPAPFFSRVPVPVTTPVMA